MIVRSRLPKKQNNELLRILSSSQEAKGETKCIPSHVIQTYLRITTRIRPTLASWYVIRSTSSTTLHDLKSQRLILQA